MKSVKSKLARWYFIAMGPALALVPTVAVLAKHGGGGSASD